ncbi:MAG: hypothetical protein COB33_002340 [Thiotrichaceae bacterium]|nr:hypothetical protein [Thiotrichaceae bacterium]
MLVSVRLSSVLLDRDRGFLEDTREDHKTDPITKWFVAETDRGRKLKVVFMQADNLDIHIKSAYMANEDEKWIYAKYTKPLK